MPIEIKELVIRATIDPKGETREGHGGKPDRLREDVVAECVEQVLEILRRRRER